MLDPIDRTGACASARPAPRARLRLALPLGLLLAVALASAGACDAGAAPATTNTAADSSTDGGSSDAAPTDTPSDATPHTGHVLGRIVGPDGAGLAHLKVIACTDSTCVRGETDDQGRYDIDGLLLLPQKMQVFGSPKGYVDFYYFQDVTADNPNTAPRDIVTFPLPEMTPWPKAEGGPVTIAGGALTLDADAGGFRYPLGAAQEVGALKVGTADLPPLDAEPWVGHAAQTLAFVIQPLGVEAMDGAAFRVATVGAGLTPDAAYTAYTVDSKHGTLHELGALTVDAAGELVVPRSMGLTKLGQLFFVPVS